MAKGVARPQEYIQALCDGVTISDLAHVFHMDRRNVTEKIRNLKPSMLREGHPVYRIDEASRYLMDPLVDIEAYIKQLRPNDLPPLLLKEFWAGQLNKQKFDLNDENLWPTPDVMAVLAKVFKTLKQGVLLFADTIEAQTDLTEKQRRLITQLSDGLLVELHRTLVEGDIDAETKPKRRQAEDVLITEDDGL